MDTLMVKHWIKPKLGMCTILLGIKIHMQNKIAWYNLLYTKLSLDTWIGDGALLAWSWFGCNMINIYIGL